MNDEFYMRRCIQLALLGAGNVAPNPMVGALLVYDDRIIGEGYHREYGQAHAEVNCVNSVRAEDLHQIPESTMYVSLEPCSHFGKTPPCADMIVREKIGRVKIGCIDANQKVHGQGIKRLREAGIDVKTGILESECIHVNKRFFTYHSMKRPYVILKWAQSQNGMMGRRGERVKISNTYTSLLVHQWRSEEPAILIGNNTAETDDPLLTNRYGTGKNPVRIVLSGKNVPENLRMYHEDGQTIVFNTLLQKEERQVKFIKVSGEEYLSEVMRILFDSGIQSILVEGGAITHQRFFDSGLWDECRIITNTRMVISDGVASPVLPGMAISESTMIMDDLVQVVFNPQNPFATSDKSLS